MAYVHDRTQLILRHDIVCRVGVNTHQHEYPACKCIDNKNHRGKYRHQKSNHPDIGKRELVRFERGKILWRNLSKYQNRHGQNTGCQTDHITSESVSDRGGQGCSIEIDDIVANQNRTQHL